MSPIAIIRRGPVVILLAPESTCVLTAEQASALGADLQATARDAKVIGAAVAAAERDLATPNVPSRPDSGAA